MTMINESIKNQMNDKQLETLIRRLNKPNVKPLKLYKTPNTDSIVLNCLNTNLNNPEPFTFIFFKNGSSRGNGYNYPVDQYELLFDFTNAIA